MIDNDKNLIAELEKRLCWYRDEATEEEFDPEEVDAICTMLLKLSPIEEPHMEKDEAYRNIMKRVREENLEKEEEAEEGEPDREEAKTTREKSDLDGIGEAGDEKGTGRERPEGERTDEERKGKESDKGRKRIYFLGKQRYRAAILFIVAFGVAILSLNMVTYAREDKSLFTMILERVGVLKISKDIETVSINDGEKNFYESWTELDSEIKSKIAVPEYIPSGYMLYGVKAYNINDRNIIKANYYDKGDGHLVIEIRLWDDENRTYRGVEMDEDMYIMLSEYSDENTLYYQYDDEYICIAHMKNGFYQISGNIAIEEMIKVREGLGYIG